MVTWLFIGNLIFCAITMYIYGEFRYRDGLHDGIELNIQKIEKED